MSSWVSKVIVHLRDLVFVVWQHCNSCLHDTLIGNLLGVSYILDQSVRSEWRIGLVRIPATLLSSILLLILMAMKGTVADRKEWFVLVRQARDQIHGYTSIYDLSDPNGSFCAWIGL